MFSTEVAVLDVKIKLVGKQLRVSNLVNSLLKPRAKLIQTRKEDVR